MLEFFYFLSPVKKSHSPSARLPGSSLPVPSAEAAHTACQQEKEHRGKGYRYTVSSALQDLYMMPEIWHPQPQPLAQCHRAELHSNAVLATGASARPQDLPSLKCLWFVFLQKWTKWIQTAMWLMGHIRKLAFYKTLCNTINSLSSIYSSLASFIGGNLLLWC